MPFTTLVDTSTLASHLHRDDWAIVDCRLALDQPAWGLTEYEKAHIPGAVFADTARDLAGPKTGANGRHPLPDPDTLARTLSRFGIDSGVQVVVYDQDIGMYASRLWWMLRWMGHANVAVLDGGWARWVAESRPTKSGVETRPPRVFVGSPRPDMLATVEEVASRTHDTGARLVDARAPERYRGEIEPYPSCRRPHSRRRESLLQVERHGQLRHEIAKRSPPRNGRTPSAARSHHTRSRDRGLASPPATTCSRSSMPALAARNCTGIMERVVSDPSRGVAKGNE